MYIYIFSVFLHIRTEQFTVRRAFLDDVRSLRVRLVLVGLAHVVLLPFLLMFMLVYFFLQNAQEWHSSKVCDSLTSGKNGLSWPWGRVVHGPEIRGEGGKGEGFLAFGGT